MNFSVSKLCGSITVYHFRHERRSLFSAEQISHISRTVCTHIRRTGHKSQGERTYKQALTAPPYPHVSPPPFYPDMQKSVKSMKIILKLEFSLAGGSLLTSSF